MQKKIAQILKSKKGVTTVQTVSIFLVIMVVFSVVMEYISFTALAQEVETAGQLSLDSLLMENAMDLFDSVKNGRSSINTAWQSEETYRLKDRNQEGFTQKLLAQLGIEGSSNAGKYYRGTENSPVFVVPTDEVDVVTATDSLLVVKTGVRVGKDLVFFGKRVADIQMNLYIESRYTKMSAISSGQVERKQESTTLGDLFNKNNGIAKETQSVTPNTGGTVQGDKNGTVTAPHGSDFSITD